MQARGVVATAPRQIEVREVETPDPGPDDVVVRVTHSWISNGTEGSFVRGERIAGDTPRSENDPMPFPHIPGYQKVGIVESVGANVTHIAPGERVFATVSKVSGMFYDFAGHISPAVTHQSQIWKLPDTLNPIAASGLVLAQVGYNIGMRPQIAAGEVAVVLGDGLVGHWAGQTFQHRGAEALLVGRRPDRLRVWHGISVYVPGEDMVETVREFAPNGIQALADTIGNLEAVYALLPLMRHDSHLASAGFYGHEGKIDIQRLRNQEITLHCPAGWNRARMDATLALIAQGALKTLPLITHRFPVARAADAFALILERPRPFLGVILDWES
jgi:2-desacetyl-2-hydroxyethyl bacteriochlorophyllide A dehydrogenase